MREHKASRRYELDWLRVIAILVVFLYHSTRFFNLGDWHVKNVDTFVWLEMWNVFATRWMMHFSWEVSLLFGALMVVTGHMMSSENRYSGWRTKR